MRLWLLLPGSVLLICGILLMFSIAFSFVMGGRLPGSVSAIIWYLAIPITPIAIGLTMIVLAPREPPPT